MQIPGHERQRFLEGQGQQRSKTLADDVDPPIAGPHLVTQQGNGGERSGAAESAGRSRPGRVVAVEQQLGQEQHDAGMTDPGQAESAKRPQRPGRILARLAEAGVLTVGQAAQEHVRFGIFEPVQGIHDLDLGPALLVALFRINHQTIERGHEIADQFGNGLILDDPWPPPPR